MDELFGLLCLGGVHLFYIPNQCFNPNRWGQWLVASFTNLVSIFQPDANDYIKCCLPEKGECLSQCLMLGCLGEFTQHDPTKEILCKSHP